MTAKYLIRLDDACDTSNLSKWAEIERILDNFSVKPIVAVIPKIAPHTIHDLKTQISGT